MIYCFDVDGTICSITSDSDYANALPHDDVIAAVNALFDEGHTILFHTARGTLTGIDWREVTVGQLARWGVRYHTLLLGKPAADVYIDDRAVNVADWVRGGAKSSLPQATTDEDADDQWGRGLTPASGP